MHTPTCGGTGGLDRNCPVCDYKATNIRMVANVVDPKYFYSQCPNCNSTHVAITGCASVLMTIAGETKRVCFHKLSCNSCDHSSSHPWWTRVRGEYKCDKCGFRFDLNSPPIPEHYLHEFFKKNAPFVRRCRISCSVLRTKAPIIPSPRE